jgi:hypothetical protein
MEIVVLIAVEITFCITEEGNEFGHFRETFGGMKFAPVPVSGEDILNAYGTALGGGKLKTENKTTIRY